MTAPPSYTDRLSIFVITYNRAAKLKRTLGYLADGPFAACGITVLDNGSTDDTPAVCRGFEGRVPRFTVIRHRVNLGLTPNYLRAVELACSEYTWVLGDDDVLDFADVGDVINQIERGSADLIVVGAVDQPQWARGMTAHVQELLDAGFPYFYVMGWITGVIFRTELFDQSCFQLGYRNADSAFPHFYFYTRCAERNVEVYLARRFSASSREPVDYGRPGSEMLAGYMYSMRYITDRALREQALRHGPLGQGRYAGLGEAAALLFRVFGVHNAVKPGTSFDVWSRCFAVAGWRLRLALLPAAVHLVVPGGVARASLALYRRLRGRRVPEHVEFTGART